MRSATARRWTWVVGALLVLLSCGLGWWILVRGNDPFTVDAWWNELLASGSAPAVTGFAQVMNTLGGGWIGVLVIPLGGAIVLFAMRRPWAAAYFLAAEAVSAAGVQVLKHLFGRSRPDDILIVSDYGSFPSGHTANAATLAVVAFVLLPRAWVVVAGTVWVLAMAFSRTWLHAHWLSDTVGGMLIGTGAALLLAAAFARPLLRERDAPSPAAP